MKIHFAASLFVSIASLAVAQPTSDPGRTNGWRADIDTLLSHMKQQHYVYKTKPLPAALTAKAAELKGSVDRFSDERMALELEKLMYYMHDGHSYVLPFVPNRSQTYYLPVQFYVFEDGVFIIGADVPYTSLIGCKVQTMNGISADSIVKDMQTYIHQDNIYTTKWFAPTFLRFRGLHEMYGLKPSSHDVRMELVDRNNRTVHQSVAFVPVTALRGIPKLIPSQLPDSPPPPLYLSNVAKNFWLERMPEKNLLYFQFNQVQDAENESLSEFSKRLDGALSAMKPRLFIIDVRHNNGGNKMLLRPLIDVIKKYERSDSAASIVVITGRNTFSAAQVFIALLDKETKALFAGEPSASSPNFVGEEGNMFNLPWSGAMGNISYRYHENIPGDTRQWIEPDLPVTLSSAAYFENRDPVMMFLIRKFDR
ncbi:MAG: hypothetical protein HYV29_03290 [Ignavibacteriales bacterium]|nr:hypothetical protein [Ignavibacteriales bacterium]